MNFARIFHFMELSLRLRMAISGDMVHVSTSETVLHTINDADDD